MDSILEQADVISQKSPDEAARFLAPYRKSCCEKIHESPAAIGDLLQITSAQVGYLNDAGAPDKAVGIAEWFLHVLHHLEEDHPEVDFKQLKRALRESFSRFFRRYARTLRDLDRIEDMRLAMRTALDLTHELPMAIVSMIHLYLPLSSRERLEDEPASEWLLKRYAETLAALDFSGLHDTPFREALDNFQYALRCPDKIDEMSSEIDALCLKNSGDYALKTLYNLFNAAYCRG